MKSYSPDQILLVFKGVLIQSFAPDSFVKVGRNTKTVTLEVGAGGDVVRVFSKDKTGYVEVDILAASATNDLLSAIQRSDETFHDGVGSVMLKDSNSLTLAHGDEACLEGPSDIERGKGMPTQKWKILVAKIDMKIGGAFT